MIRRIPLQEDLALKRLVSTPRGDKQSFSWREVLAADTEDPSSYPEITILSGREERQFSLADVADEIGNALTDLLLSREEQDIFTEQNRGFVANVAHSVANLLIEQVRGGRSLRLSENDLSLLIEKALIENNAHDVAKSLVFNRSVKTQGTVEVTAESSAPIAARLIRRNGLVVPWNEAKIEIACRKAFLSAKIDPSSAGSVARGVTERIRTGDSAFMHIEDVQDLVQEELMRQGHYKVAESYILYRDQRARLREEIALQPQEEVQQDSLIVVRGKDGESIFWDGSELKKRIQFASIGLHLDMEAHDIERELRRSIGTEITDE
ncbi:MAG: ATP cone domain-containing protein, partial [Chthoniobacterales bacterium]